MSGPTEFEAVATDDGLAGPGLQNDEDEVAGPIAGRSLTAIAWRRLRRDRIALAGGVVVVLFILVAVLAGPITAIYGQNYATQHNTGNSLLDPLTQMPQGAFSGASGTHWLGVTPVLGLDILANLIYGAQTSLIVGFLATAFSLVLGVTLGVIAGFARGWVDTVISRIMDVLLSFPTLLFSIALIAVSSYINSSEVFRFSIIIFVLGFFGWPYIGRIVRGQVLTLREKEFVEAARSLGASNGRIMAREIAPNLVGPVLVYTTLAIPNNILGEAGLSFLGIGVIPPTPSWGQMLSDASQYVQVDPWYLFMPGLAIFITVLAFNLFGDGLRDALDPKSTR
ncbi:ABC transporter permease [Amnibacterium sp.]|uniref:ABC transporter permease n=1 Tax=Amnibacterium sp. TaxID=1872496 RepID=UPI003F7BE209